MWAGAVFPCQRCGGRHALSRLCPAKPERWLTIPDGARLESTVRQHAADVHETARIAVYRRRAPSVLASRRAMMEAVDEAFARAEVAHRLDARLERM